MAKKKTDKGEVTVTAPNGSTITFPTESVFTEASEDGLTEVIAIHEEKLEVQAIVPTLDSVAYGFAKDTDNNWYVVTIPYNLQVNIVGAISKSHPDGSRGVVMERFMVESANRLLVNE